MYSRDIETRGDFLSHGIFLKTVKNTSNNNNKRMQQISSERILDKTRLGGEGDPLGIVQEV